MKLSPYSPTIMALLGFLLINLSPLHGTDATAAPKPKKIPFHGPIVAVDTTAQTITVGKTKRVFHVTADTKITDGTGAASTLAAAVVGEDSGGSYDKATMNLYSLRIGAKTGSKEKAAAATAAAPAPAPAPAPAVTTPPPPPPPAPAPQAAAPAPAPGLPAAAIPPKTVPFSGKVVSVDAASNTLVVHFRQKDQPFTVSSTTTITGASGLASITVGSHVSGKYSKSADGTRVIETVTVKAK